MRFSSGRIDWPLAVGASVAVHAAIVGACFVFGSGGGASAPSAPDGTPAAERTDGAAEKLELPQPLPQPLPEADAGVAEYIVKAGDSLTKIARLHSCTVAEIVTLNDFKTDKRLNIGETIKIPAKPGKEQVR